MIYFLWLAVAFLVFIIQGSISIFDVTPNFTAVLSCYAGIRKREIRGMLFGALIGIIEDSLSGSFVGPNLLSKGLIGYLSSLVYSRFFMWTPLLGMISIFVLTSIDSSVVFIARSFFDKIPVSIGSAAFIILIQSLLNAPLGILLKPKEYAQKGALES